MLVRTQVGTYTSSRGDGCLCAPQRPRWGGKGSTATSRRCCSSSKIVVRAAASASDNNISNSGAPQQPVLLNEHTLWLQAADASRPLLFGASYVLFPPPQQGGGAGGAGAAGRRSGTGPAPLAVVPLGPTGIVPFGAAEAVVLPRGADGWVEAAVPVDVEVLPPPPPPQLPGRARPRASLPQTTTTALAPRAPAGGAVTETGIVPVTPAPGAFDQASIDSNGDSNNVYETFSNASPRRKHKIKFTCRRCGATSVRPISLHAWTEGTVFARCGGCNVTHKLIDNLKLFHEMAGPVFTPSAPPLPAEQLPAALASPRLDELLGAGDGTGIGGSQAPPRIGGYDGFSMERFGPFADGGGSGGGVTDA